MVRQRTALGLSKIRRLDRCTPLVRPVVPPQLGGRLAPGTQVRRCANAEGGIVVPGWKEQSDARSALIVHQGEEFTLRHCQVDEDRAIPHQDGPRDLTKYVKK